MARYIDADKLCKGLEEMAAVLAPFKQSTILGVVETIKNIPTADVVPKSEVERWRRNLEAVLEEIPETKREVAREIFEEIEEVFRQHTEGGYYLNGAWFPERLDLYTGDAIAELKKKYT